MRRSDFASEQISSGSMFEVGVVMSVVQMNKDAFDLLEAEVKKTKSDAIKLDTHLVSKPWGRTVLPKPFVNPGTDKIGEIWFQSDDAPEMPLMVKYLFTSEKLSIQVHPNDSQAQAVGQKSGKEECWLVLDAEPGACLGIGTRRPLDADELRGAALSGEIEELMEWKPVQRGDFFYIPAGTVHAIGAGVSLIEIQQNADITYRLYDYGRPRELHLDDGVAVSKAEPYSNSLQRSVDFAQDQTLVDGPLFRLTLTGDVDARLSGRGPLILIPLEGSVTVQRSESLKAGPGECLAINPETPIEASDGARMLLARAI